MTNRLLVLVLCGACGTDDPEVTATANAAILPTAGQTVSAMAVFEAAANVTLTITIADAAPGVHGMHIHQVADCGMDGMAAGGHWDGSDASGDPNDHGLPDSALHHIGDLGNVTIAADGTGTLERGNELWTLGDGAATDVVGHAIIFHAATDDGTMPSAGARHGCGIIVPNQ